MDLRKLFCCIGLGLALAGRIFGAPEGDPDPVIRAAFEEKTLTEGEASLVANAGTGEAVRRKYALGIVRFLRSAERLGQTWRRHGLYANRLTASLPFLRLPVGQSDPRSVQPIAYDDVRAALVTFLADLQAADETFAALPDEPGKVTFRPGFVRIDYVGAGKPAETETAWKTFAKLNAAEHLTETDAANFLIRFDAGDVPWFRGYCHLLSAFAETLLAYDETELFDHAAHLFFDRPKTPFPFLQIAQGSAMNFDVAPISDIVTFVHLLRFPVREPARLATALDDLTQVVKFSRESWRRILAETDDDHEWIPNPRQHGALPRTEVTQEKIDAWLAMLDEADAILAGKKLIPFWRGHAGPWAKKGFNLRRAFLEPGTFDLWLWIQGTAAAPYLEDGEITNTDVWHGLQNAFSGEALGFSLYFN